MTCSWHEPADERVFWAWDFGFLLACALWTVAWVWGWIRDEEDPDAG